MTIRELTKPSDNPRRFSVQCKAKENPIPHLETILPLGSHHPGPSAARLWTYTLVDHYPDINTWTVEAAYADPGTHVGLDGDKI